VKNFYLLTVIETINLVSFLVSGIPQTSSFICCSKAKQREGCSLSSRIHDDLWKSSCR